MKKFHSLMAVALVLANLGFQNPAVAGNDKSTAKITEAHGDVFKRGFVDWEKDIWDDPSPAKKGELMKEGMQLGTGDKSWAQLTWSYINARAWANSVYAIAPSQRLVYLMGGEMLYHLDKHRKDKDDYYVWTKLIQARIRGTTVLFQSTKDATRVTVMEGSIDVMNRKDKSIVHLEPGVVYEVKEVLTAEKAVDSNTATKAASSATINSSATSLVANQPLSGVIEMVNVPTQVPASFDTMQPITLPDVKPVTIFQTKLTQSLLYVANPGGLLSHPLLSALELPLGSLSLVTGTLNSLLPIVGDLTSGLEGVLNKTLLSDFKVLAVPKTLSYSVGPAVGKSFVLPPTTAFFPPIGVIGAPAGTLGQMPQVSGLFNSPQISQLGSAGFASTSAALPVTGLGGAIPTSVMSAIPGATMAGGGGIAGLAGVSGMSGMTTGFAAALPAFAGARTAGVVGGLPVAGVVGGVTGTVSGVVGGVGGTVGGVTGAVGGLTGGTGLGGVTGTVNQLLQNTTGGIGHLFGH